LRVHPGEQGRPRRAATRSGVILRQPQATRRQVIQVRRGNFRTVAANIGITQVVRQYQNNVRPRRIGFGGEPGPSRFFQNQKT